jgi:hypothetical protein
MYVPKAWILKPHHFMVALMMPIHGLQPHILHQAYVLLKSHTTTKISEFQARMVSPNILTKVAIPIQAKVHPKLFPPRVQIWPDVR